MSIPSDALASATSKRRRILVVEDEAIVAADLEDRLEILGFEVCGIADTCDGAISDALALQPDLVLMDIHLIGPRDGVDAAIEIRAASRIPVVFLTAHSDDDTLSRILPAAPFGFILKPFAERELKATLEVAFYRQQAEIQLSKMERSLATTLSSMADGVIATDIERRIKFINPMAEDMTGWFKNAAVGRDIGEVFSLEKHGNGVSVADLLNLASQEGGAKYLEGGHSLLVRDGRKLPVADSIAVIRDDDDTITGWVIIFRDVSAMFESEKEEKRLREKIVEAQRLETFGILAGGFAHDFNNLLQVITTGASLSRTILDEAGGPEALKELRDLLDHIEGAADKGTDLCGQLLAIAGKSRRELKKIELSAFTRDAAGLLRTVVHRNAALALDLANDLPFIRIDPGQLQQLIMNLVLNASEALEGGSGRIAIETSRFKADAASFSVCRIGDDLPVGDYVLFKVVDNGCGMTPELMARIFDPFFTTKFHGRGLGLATVAGIIRSCGGALYVESTVGRGTCFQIALPAVAPELPPAPKAAPLKVAPPKVAPPKLAQSAPWTGSGLVLLVDDEPAIRTTCGMMLKRLGFDVELADNGRAALAMVLKNHGNYRLVCMDMTMPVMSGHEAFMAIRAHFPALPIVMMSGYADDLETGLVGDQRPTAFLHKPFSMQDLTDLLPKILGAGITRP